VFLCVSGLVSCFDARDHTTVLHAVRKIEALVGNDNALAEEIESLKRQLQD
jgi:chromosomal replication initiator protein